METQIVENILFSDEKAKTFDSNQIVPELTLSFMVSGKKHLQFSDFDVVGQPGDIALIRKNELIKSIKMSDDEGFSYKSVSIFFTPEILQEYAKNHNIPTTEKYKGKPYIDLTQSKFIRAYFESFMPYFNQVSKLTGTVASIKSLEALELLMNHHPNLEQMIFDLTEPYKIDLEKYMNKNFTFKIPIKEFARLTGRSLSTFKRDFKKTYNETPEKWLREKRLDEAKYLIVEKKQRPSDVYYHVGFENFSHFSTSFKERFGVNASEI